MTDIFAYTFIGGILAVGYYLLPKGKEVTGDFPFVPGKKIETPPKSTEPEFVPSIDPIKQFIPAYDISDRGVEFIARKEGFRSDVYLDEAGYPTIGYGHKIEAGESFTKITEEEGAELLKKDLQIAVSSVRRRVDRPLTQGQFDSLVSFVFNVGDGAFMGSTLLKKLNSRDFDGAAKEFARWKYITKGGQKIVSNGLVNRRKEEQQLFLT